VLGRHEYVLFSVVEANLYLDLIETERPGSHQPQVVVGPARGALTHGLRERLDEDRPKIRPLEHPAIDLGKLLKESRDGAFWIITQRPSRIAKCGRKLLR